MIVCVGIGSWLLTHTIALGLGLVAGAFLGGVAVAKYHHKF